MKSKRRQLKSTTAFTIVELIAVIAVIAILIGLLVPALSMVQKMAATVSQKAQFSTISIGLEAFREDQGDYPESNNMANYTGAQRLAEAMIGQDGFGYHPQSVFHSDGTDISGTIPLYKPGIDSLTADQIAANIASRKGPYLELDTANAVMLGDIYGNTGVLLSSTFILADKFKNVKNKRTSKKTGMPILYFKANTISVSHPASVLPSTPAATFNSFIYSFFDNQELISFISPFDGSANLMAAPVGGATIFYKSTANPNFTTTIRPHNNESFILLSAGPDGNYGTGDDIYNFENGE